MTGHENIGDQFRTGAKGIFGIGEAIRGTAMDTLDSALNTHSGDRKNKAIADKGLSDMRAADSTLSGHHHHHSGTSRLFRTMESKQHVPGSWE